MKAPVGLLSDRTVLRSKMEGLRPDKFQFGELNTKLNTEKLTVDTHRHVKSRRSFFIPKISG